MRGEIKNKQDLSDLDQSVFVERARRMYGDEAPTAVAYCALEAWSEQKEDEYQFWIAVFHRLRN